MTTKTTKTGLSHRCPDGTVTRQLREGPLGIGDDSFIFCPNCGRHDSTASLSAAYKALQPKIVEALMAREGR